MSLLPQRKKSANEIAKLRESFGLPGQTTIAEEVPSEAAVSTTERIQEIPVVASDLVLNAPAEIHEKSPVSDASNDGLAPLPVAGSPVLRAVRSLKRSERIPVLPLEDAIADAKNSEKLAISASTHPREAKQVRSLRKSELVPLTAADHHAPSADSKLPSHRHNDRELNEIRRQTAIDMQAAADPYVKMNAHLALVIPGYLLAIGGGVGFYFYNAPIGAPVEITAACAALALLIAGFIFLKKPLSRHHAAFIAVISFFVIIFGALHYFPQLQHGT